MAVYYANGGSYVAHVGDSRVYRIRRDTITQLTEDHSLLNDYIKMKELTPEEIENFPHKNVIVRALGMKETVQVDTQFEIPQHGDIYLCCSDGLSGMVDKSMLLKLVLEANQDLEAACQKVIDEANRNGGTDNITVVMSQFVED